MARNIYSSRDLIIQLFKRDFLAVYKKSFLGLAWIFIGPTLSVVPWVFMSMSGILKPGDVGIAYPAYVFFSTYIWTVFTGFYTASVGTLGAGSGFILQVKYPHEALLIKQAAQHVANILISLMINIFVLFLFGARPSWYIFLFPILILPLFFLGAGIGLIVSVIGVVSNEIQRGFDFLISSLILVTPVIYSSKIENETLQVLLKWNPLTYLVGGTRDLIIYGHMSHPDRFIYMSIISILFFMFSWRLFFLSEEKVIEKIL